MSEVLSKFSCDHIPEGDSCGLVVTLVEQNAKLRKLAAEMHPYAKAFLRQGVMLGCTDSKSYDWFLQLRELGVEVES